MLFQSRETTGRILFLILVGLLLIGCASRVQVTGVYSDTLMNGQSVYYVQTDEGDRRITLRVYKRLVDKLNGLSAGHGLGCDMEKAPGSNVYDISCCSPVVLVVVVQEWGE